MSKNIQFIFDIFFTVQYAEIIQRKSHRSHKLLRKSHSSLGSFLLRII